MGLLIIGSYKDIVHSDRRGCRDSAERSSSLRRITTPLCGGGGSFDFISFGRTSRRGYFAQDAWGKASYRPMIIQALPNFIFVSPILNLKGMHRVTLLPLHRHRLPTPVLLFTYNNRMHFSKDNHNIPYTGISKTFPTTDPFLRTLSDYSMKMFDNDFTDLNVDN